MKDLAIAIVGAGPAGLACAIQLKRMGLSPVIFEGRTAGGMLVNANLVENYPGFPNGVSGKKLATLFRKHAGRFDLRLVSKDILSVKLQQERFLLSTPAGEYLSDILVVASGTQPKIPDDMPPGLRGSGQVHFEVHEVTRSRHKEIGIIGAGDAAFDYALNLAGRGNNVTLFNRGSRIKALRLLVERASAQPRIRYFQDARLLDGTILPGKRLKLVFRLPEKTTEHVFNNVIFATGREPNIGFLSKQIIDNQNNLIKSHRLYMIGDVMNGRHRQTAIATGDGIRAAMEIQFHASHPEDSTE